MKYTTEVVINRSRDDVIELMDNQDNLKEWQSGLVSADHISGEPGQVGAQMRMHFKERGRDVKMTETVMERNFPDRFVARYEANGVDNIMVNRFVEEGPSRTRWITESEFKFGFFMSIMAVFMGGAFRKETQKTMDAFKAFAEGQANA
ncbi:MAG: SRPBCC family protein [Chloroflexota bacterium]